MTHQLTAAIVKPGPYCVSTTREHARWQARDAAEREIVTHARRTGRRMPDALRADVWSRCEAAERAASRLPNACRCGACPDE